MKYAFVLFIFASICTKAQIITTIAGNGVGGSSGDGGPATAARVAAPAGGAFDRFGNFYFADQLSDKIRKIAPSGIITTVAGSSIGGFWGDGGPATNARLDGPNEVVLDTFGNMYIADVNNHRIRKVDASTGAISTFAGTGLTGYSGDGGPATAANLWAIQDICIDKFGNLYIADGFNYRIRKVSPTGIISTFAGNGTPGYSGEGTLATSSMVWLVGGLCSDTDGNIYFSNISGSLRVMKINLAGTMTTVAGNGVGAYAGDGIPATSAQIAPLRLHVDNHGVLYIADKVNNRVYKVDPITGILTNIAGNGSSSDLGDGGISTAASMYAPVAAIPDKCGNLYIPTIGNISVAGSGNRIRKVTFNPGGIGTISITVTPNDTVCAGTLVNFTATTTGASTAGYQWYKNGVAVPGATNATYSYTATTVEGGDSVRCVYTGIDVCSIAGNPGSNVLHIVATPLTMPTIAVSSAASATLGSVVTVNATVGSAGGSYSIKWYKNSALFTTTSVPTATYIKGTGTDVITARVSSTDATGCYDTATAGAINIAVAPVQVLQLQAPTAVQVYPNPATHSVTVDAGAAIKVISITNVAGRVYDVPHTVVAPGTHVLDVARLPAGVYLLQVTDEYGNKVVKRLVKG